MGPVKDGDDVIQLEQADTRVNAVRSRPIRRARRQPSQPAPARQKPPAAVPRPSYPRPDPTGAVQLPAGSPPPLPYRCRPAPAAVPPAGAGPTSRPRDDRPGQLLRHGPVIETIGDQSAAGARQGHQAVSGAREPRASCPNRGGSPPARWGGRWRNIRPLSRERPPIRLLEAEVGVRAGPAQDQRAAIPLVDQDPVRLDVAIPPPLPIAGQRVVSVLRLQGAMMAQRLDDRAELVRVLA